MHEWIRNLSPNKWMSYMATCKVIVVGFLTQLIGRQETSYSVPAFIYITAAFT
jgi:hypothetical protein